ncbi:hypothetical protein V8G54_012026 [Vigna mungo]|uniref:Uncharacterized protein n=1 Tax=Vigna mungo TaxID=3915 RepID=A0AAQ3NQB8_VIGMU
MVQGRKGGKRLEDQALREYDLLVLDPSELWLRLLVTLSMTVLKTTMLFPPTPPWSLIREMKGWEGGEDAREVANVRLGEENDVRLGFEVEECVNGDAGIYWEEEEEIIGVGVKGFGRTMSTNY